MTEKKKLTLSPKTLSAKGPSVGASAGNSTKVSVVKTRNFERDKYGNLVQKTPAAGLSQASPASSESVNNASSNLSQKERDARLEAIKNATLNQEKISTEQSRLDDLQERERKRQEQLKEAERQLKINQQQREQEQAKHKEQLKNQEQAPNEVKEPPAHSHKEKIATKSSDANNDDFARPEKKRHNAPKSSVRNEGRRQNNIDLTRAINDEGEIEERQRSIASIKRARVREKLKNQEQESQEKRVRDVILPETITVGDLANRMAERLAVVIKALMKMGVMATQNQVIDADTAELIANELGHKVKRVAESDVENVIDHDDDDEGDLTPRSAVITVMGHVDHGKTSLLDSLRTTDIASGEAGGITQHIGAYQVALDGNRVITFLDTPGHEAFTAMRARGTEVTDIVVLVVAADDGVRPQTIEAINHALAAQVPIVVAINKCDKPGADPQRVRTELLNHNIVVEELGGDVQSVEVSAKQHLNLDKLTESLLIQADILELQANANRAAHGVVVESRQEKGRGNTATILVQKGTLRKGDIFISGREWGRVRTLLDYRGHALDCATPSQPVQVFGLQGLPEAGDDFIVVQHESQAREISEYRTRKKRDSDNAKLQRGSLEQMFNNIQSGDISSCPVVIKSDVQGSLEAIKQSLEKLNTDEVTINILHGAVGGITETDISLAASSSGLVFGFNVRATPQARELARKENIDIRYYSIIYELIDDTRSLMSGYLKPEEKEEILGYGEIREVFNITGVGKVAGCFVTEGVLRRGVKVRLLRDNIVIYDGALKQLKRFKDDVKEAASGYECGMSLENYDDIKQSDVIECYHILEIERQL